MGVKEVGSGEEIGLDRIGEWDNGRVTLGDITGETVGMSELAGAYGGCVPEDDDATEEGGTDGYPNGFMTGAVGKFKSGAEKGVAKGVNSKEVGGMPWGIGANGVPTMIWS
jgi:hypothetical protein